MKHIFFILPLFALFITCERQGTQNAVANTNAPAAQERAVSAEEAIITWGRGREVPAFQIEGNFTGSGNREIIAFYDRRIANNRFRDIHRVRCFVFDSSGVNIESVFEIGFTTGEFTNRHEPMTGFTSDFASYLGSPIVHRNPIVHSDRVIGRFGDFNNNGRDELFLFRLSGIAFQPYFFEFNGTEFAETLILDRLRVTNASIVGVNPVERTITLREETVHDRAFQEVPMDITARTNTYAWDETARQYVLLSSEVRYYLWNRESQEFEEIQL